MDGLVSLSLNDLIELEKNNYRVEVGNTHDVEHEEELTNFEFFVKNVNEFLQVNNSIDSK